MFGIGINDEVFRWSQSLHQMMMMSRIKRYFLLLFKTYLKARDAIDVG